jgi:hypothetical protein
VYHSNLTSAVKQSLRNNSIYISTRSSTTSLFDLNPPPTFSLLFDIVRYSPEVSTPSRNRRDSQETRTWEQPDFSLGVRPTPPLIAHRINLCDLLALDERELVVLRSCVVVHRDRDRALVGSLLRLRFGCRWGCEDRWWRWL